MKTTLKIILWTITMLLISSVLSYKNELPVDGLERYGFPYRIYEACGDCVEGYKSGHHWDKLLLNGLIYAVIVSFLYFNFKKINKKIKEKSGIN
jgi:hypothetical protein